MKVAVWTTIDCAHQLPGTQMHGHTYRITATMMGPLTDSGVVIGFDILRKHLAAVLIDMDHKQLESTIGEPATAERLALVIQKRLALRIGNNLQIRVAVGDDGWVET